MIAEGKVLVLFEGGQHDGQTASMHATSRAIEAPFLAYDEADRSLGWPINLPLMGYARYRRTGRVVEVPAGANAGQLAEVVELEWERWPQDLAAEREASRRREQARLDAVPRWRKDAARLLHALSDRVEDLAIRLRYP